MRGTHVCAILVQMQTCLAPSFWLHVDVSPTDLDSDTEKPPLIHGMPSTLAVQVMSVVLVVVEPVLQPPLLLQSTGVLGVVNQGLSEVWSSSLTLEEMYSP